MAMNQGVRADLVARLRDEAGELARYTKGNSRAIAAMREASDALAALPPPADPLHDCEAWRLEGLGCARCNKADPPALVALGERLRTQDNRASDIRRGAPKRRAASVGVRDRVSHRRRRASLHERQRTQPAEVQPDLRPQRLSERPVDRAAQSPDGAPRRPTRSPPIL